VHTLIIKISFLEEPKTAGGPLSMTLGAPSSKVVGATDGSSPVVIRATSTKDGRVSRDPDMTVWRGMTPSSAMKMSCSSKSLIRDGLKAY
jgi:hypothetical protein